MILILVDPLHTFRSLPPPPHPPPCLWTTPCKLSGFYGFPKKRYIFPRSSYLGFPVGVLFLSLAFVCLCPACFCRRCWWTIEHCDLDIFVTGSQDPTLYQLFTVTKAQNVWITKYKYWGQEKRSGGLARLRREVSKDARQAAANILNASQTPHMYKQKIMFEHGKGSLIKV